MLGKNSSFCEQRNDFCSTLRNFRHSLFIPTHQEREKQDYLWHTSVFTTFPANSIHFSFLFLRFSSSLQLNICGSVCLTACSSLEHQREHVPHSLVHMFPAADLMLELLMWSRCVLALRCGDENTLSTVILRREIAKEVWSKQNVKRLLFSALTLIVYPKTEKLSSCSSKCILLFPSVEHKKGIYAEYRRRLLCVLWKWKESEGVTLQYE